MEKVVVVFVFFKVVICLVIINVIRLMVENSVIIIGMDFDVWCFVVFVMVWVGIICVI